MKSEIRKIERTPEEQARLREIKQRFQREKPSLRKLVETGDADPAIPLSAYLGIGQLFRRLRDERVSLGLSLADLAERTGMDRAAISRLENGHHSNPTIDTVIRYAEALGKSVQWTVTDVAVVPPA